MAIWGFFGGDVSCSEYNDIRGWAYTYIATTSSTGGAHTTPCKAPCLAELAASNHLLHENQIIRDKGDYVPFPRYISINPASLIFLHLTPGLGLRDVLKCRPFMETLRHRRKSRGPCLNPVSDQVSGIHAQRHASFITLV